MSPNDEDRPPQASIYEWNPNSDLSLPEFLTKYKPSMVQNDGTKPWIWVRSPTDIRYVSQEEADAEEDALEFLQDVSEKVEAVQNDESIPIRSSKKTGAKSKKEVREQIQTDAASKLKEISQKYGYVSGKWLIFSPSDKVDMIWSNLAISLVSGPLASTSAHLAKVSTCRRDSGTTPYQHVICLYMPDVYDKPAVIEVMKVLLRNHGLNLAGVKSNLYTVIGIAHKHPSGISPTIWKPIELMSDAEIMKLKDAFYADPPKQAVPMTPVQPTEKKDTPAAPRKTKLKMKAPLNDDPFASDVDDDAAAGEESRKRELKSKTVNVAKAKPNASTSNAKDVEVEAKRPRKKRKF